MMEQFHFLRPLWLLTIIPLALVWYWLLHHLFQGGQWQRMGDMRLLSHLLHGEQRSKHPLYLLAGGWLMAVIALAGPSWQQEEQPVFKPLKSLVIALDLSSSMLAADLPPSRLERAKQKVRDAAIRGSQVALVVFAGDAFTVVPLTEDINTMTLLLPALNPEVMPVAGSRPSRALEEGVKLLQQAGSDGGLVLLITDGDAHPSDSLTAAGKLANQGYGLAILGVGTSQGAPIPKGKGGFIQDQHGKPVMATLDKGLLRDLAAAAGGRFQEITSDDADLDQLLQWPHIGGHTATQHTSSRWRDAGAWLLLPLLLLAASAFRRGWLFLIVFSVPILFSPPARADSWSDLWQRPDQQGARAMDHGQPAEAAELFTDPAWQGTALYRAERFAEAATAFAKVPTADGHYNQGNALVQAGQLPEAAAAYRQALQQDPNHDDARHNLQSVEKAMADQQQKQPQNSSDSPQSGSEKKQENQQESPSSQEPGKSDKEEQSSAADSQKEEIDKSGQSSRKEKENPQPSGKESEDKSPPAGEKESASQKESQQAMEQWLRRIPDDPAGLMRRKFMLEHQRRRGDQRQGEPW